jgi:hypothetical protein
MNVRQKVAVAVAAAACLISTGVAVAAPLTRQHAVGAGPAATPSITSVDTSTESKFTPITPCRIVDTRHGGGALSGGVARSFSAIGSAGISAQGGASGGCGIPSAATALDVSLQSVNSTKAGFLNETASGVAFANASLLHYVKGQTIGSGATLPITGTGTFAFKLKASAGHTDVLVDVLGYYIKPMTATVNSNGTLLFGSRVVSVAGTSGQYDVQFDRSVVGCNYQATPFVTGSALVVSVGRLSSTDDTILVDTEVGGTLTAAIFYLAVTC